MSWETASRTRIRALQAGTFTGSQHIPQVEARRKGDELQCYHLAGDEVRFLAAISG